MVLAVVTRLLAVVVPLALGLVVLLPSPSWAALNAYLKLSDCDGTVTAGGSSGLIQLNTGDPAAVQEVVTLTFRRIELTDLATNTTVTFDFAENKI